MFPELLKKNKFTAAFLVFLNLLPVLALSFGWVTPLETVFFYWAEAALVVAIAILPYAKHFIVFFLMLIMITLITRVADPSTTGDIHILLTFWGLYCLAWLTYIELVKTRYWRKERRKTPSEQFMAYLIFMGIAIAVCFVITITIYGAWPVVASSSYSYFMFFFSTAVIVPTLSIGLLNIIDMIGPRHFIHFLIGTYHQPVKRDRVVMFLDMVGSTGMAEKMSPEQGMRLIATFIYDASAIFRRHHGDIVNYTGDGLVVMWPRRGANRALAAAYELNNWVIDKREEYLKDFNYAPDFRVGLHAGIVTMGQIGEEKLFIGLYGDVVNTAARIEQLNKKLGTKILLSRDATKFMDNHWLIRLKRVGEQVIRGRQKPVQVYTLKNLRTEKPSAKATNPEQEAMSMNHVQDSASKTTVITPEDMQKARQSAQEQAEKKEIEQSDSNEQANMTVPKSPEKPQE